MPVIITTTYQGKRGKLKKRGYDSSNIYGDQALKRYTRCLQQLKEKTYLQNLVLSIIPVAEINVQPMLTLISGSVIISNQFYVIFHDTIPQSLCNICLSVIINFRNKLFE